MTKNDKQLIKSALRRAFSRSELRRSVIDAWTVPHHSDPKRPRVKNWCRCSQCSKLDAKSYTQVDHIIPVIRTSEDMDAIPAFELVNRVFCAVSNLVAICKPCHYAKTKEENKARRAWRKAQNGNPDKKSKVRKRKAR